MQTGKFLSLVWLRDTKHPSMHISSNSERLQSSGQIHQFHSNSSQNLILRALLCFSAFLHFQLLTVFLIAHLSQSTFCVKLVLYFTPKLGAFNSPLSLVCRGPLDKTDSRFQVWSVQDVGGKGLFICFILITLLHCTIPTSYTSIKVLGK